MIVDGLGRAYVGDLGFRFRRRRTGAPSAASFS